MCVEEELRDSKRERWRPALAGKRDSLAHEMAKFSCMGELLEAVDDTEITAGAVATFARRVEMAAKAQQVFVER